MLEDRADGRIHSAADDLRAGRLRRLRGRVEGVHHTAHAADVRFERDQRNRSGRSRHRGRPGRVGGRTLARVDRRRPGRGQPGRRLRGHRPNAADVPRPPTHTRRGRRGGRVIPVWAQLGYLLAAVCFVLALKGLASPRTARWGNLVGALGAAVALGVVFGAGRPDNVVPILAAMLAGAAAGIVAARRGVMTAMPQMVAGFHGPGGGPRALVALLEVTGPNADGPWYVRLATAFTILVGSVAFTGSMLTFAKLQELMTGRPVVFPGLPWAFGLALAVTMLGGAWMVAEPGLAPALVVAAAALLIGVILVLPVGGADVPIVISLLNAFSGLTVAAGGYVLENALLLVAGTLGGGGGAVPTRLQATAMGRSVGNIL